MITGRPPIGLKPKKNTSIHSNLSQMSDTDGQPAHLYRPTAGTTLLNIAGSALVALLFALPLLFTLSFVQAVQRAPAELGPLRYFLLCLTIPMIFLMAVVIIEQVVNAFAPFFSYVKVSPAGLEHRQWPSKHIRCEWSQVERIGKRWLFWEALTLKGSQVIGLSPGLRMSRALHLGAQNFVPLGGYRGWPDGQLADDLRRYAPHLFSAAAPRRPAVEGGVEPVERSQEERYLSSLAHLSILFSQLGIITPVVIWVTQRDKSTYTGFQALQALVFQAALMIFNFVATACLSAFLVTPFLMAPVGPGKNAASTLLVTFFAALMLAVWLIVLVNLACIVYGLIGALLTYQGKNFRYMIIARLVEKRSSQII